MNKIILAGRLTKDSELSYIASTQTPKANFTLAVDRNYQKDKNNKKVDFINCEMLGKGAESLCQYLTKGKAIMVEGELNIDNYEKDGEKRSFTKVKVDRVEFQAGGKSEGSSGNEFQPIGLNPQGFQVIDDDDIPF